MSQVIFLKKIAYIELEYPSCMTLPEADPTTCTQLDWLNGGKRFGSDYRCSSKSNVLKIDNLNGNYPDNQFIQMKFYVELNSEHNCGKSDYVNMAMKEDIGGRTLETGGVISIF